MTPDLTSPRPARPRLSAVIACYKDGQAIPHMYERLTRALAAESVDLEIIFVNDGSPDDSKEVLARLAAADPRVVAITHTRNFGSQAAFTSGMQLCTGDAVVLMDGDLQDPPELIPQFLAKWRDGYDVVYGVRVKREATPFLQIAYKAFYRVFHALSYIEVPRDAGDFSLMDRRVIDAVNRLDERDRFLRGLRAWVGFRQVAVPVDRGERAGGRSKYSIIGLVRLAFDGLFSFSVAPLRAAWLLGACISAAASLYAIYAIFERIFLGGSPQGFTALIVAVTFFSGVQLLFLGLIGEYVGRVYDEAKGRPHFIVTEVVRREPAAQPTDESSSSHLVP